MRAFIAVKYHENNRNREHIEQISAALEGCGWETVCIARDVERWGELRFGPRTLMLKSFGEIEASDLVVVDLTEKGVGVGIEAGYAFAREVPIVTIAREGSDVSETLRGISRGVYLYSEYRELFPLFAGLPRED